MDYSSRRIRTEGGFLQYVCPKCPAYETHCYPKQRMMNFCRYNLLLNHISFRDAILLSKSYIAGNEGRTGLIGLAKEMVEKAAKKAALIFPYVGLPEKDEMTRNDKQTLDGFCNAAAVELVRITRKTVERRFGGSQIHGLLTDLLRAGIYENNLSAYENHKRFVQGKKK